MGNKASVTAKKSTDIVAVAPTTTSTLGVLENDPELFIDVDVVGHTMEIPRNFPLEVFQWAISVENYSTQYGGGWSADKVVGKPKVYPRYGDLAGAWAPSQSTGTQEYLTLTYDVPVFVTGVHIVETFHPGFVHKICAKVGNEEWVDLYDDRSNLGKAEQKSRIFSPDLKERVFHFRTNTIRIHLDCSQAPSWTEIDCVCLSGVLVLDWTPENHNSYPKNFRDAVRAFLLVNNRKKTKLEAWLPEDIIFRVTTILSNSWPYSAKHAEAFKKKQQQELIEKQQKELHLSRMISDSTCGMLELLAELLAEGAISKDVFERKKQSAHKRGALSVYKALLETGRMLSCEYTRKIDELQNSTA